MCECGANSFASLNGAEMCLECRDDKLFGCRTVSFIDKNKTIKLADIISIKTEPLVRVLNSFGWVILKRAQAMKYFQDDASIEWFARRQFEEATHRSSLDRFLILHETSLNHYFIVGGEGAVPSKPTRYQKIQDAKNAQNIEIEPDAPK